MSSDAFAALSKAAVDQLHEERDVLRQILKAVERSITFATQAEADASGLGLPEGVAWAVYWANRGELAKAVASLSRTAENE